MKRILLLVLLTWSSYVESQTEGLNLRFYADVMIHAADGNNRVLAHQSFIKLLTDRLDRARSFEDSLDSIPWISIQHTMDNRFRIISWELKISEDKYKYFGFIQLANGAYTALSDVGAIYDEIEFEEMTPDNWIGNVIFDIQKFEDYYILFGFRQGNSKHKYRIAEVLYFDNDQIVLGKPLFNFPQKSSSRPLVFNRLVLEYSATSSVNLNYSPGLNMIIYDHVIAIMGRNSEDGIVLVPDGSYEGFTYENGKWTYVEKVFNQIQDTPPQQRKRRTK